MKLKLKHVAAPAVVHRIELPDQSSLREARERCFGTLPLQQGSNAADIVLSLNKKSPLSGADDDTLKSLGVCNGDLLWVLGPNLAQSNSSSSAAAATAANRVASVPSDSSHTGNANPCNSGTANTNASAPRTAAQAAGAAALARAQARQQLYPAENAAASTATETAAAKAAAGDSGPSSMDVDSQTPQQQQQQQQQGGNDMAEKHASDADMNDAAAAAAIDLDHPPPAKPWTPDHLQRLLDHEQQQQQTLSQTQLLLLTIHAAMLESGMQLLQQQQQQQQSVTAALLPDLSGTGGVYSLAYALPDLAAPSGIGSSSGGEQPDNGGSSSGGEQPNNGSSSSSVTIQLKAMDVGNYLVMAGSITAAASSSSGTSGNSAKLAVTLNVPKTAVAPSTVLEGPAAAAAAAGAGSLITRYGDLPKLWVMLKDKLCLPLLVAACAAAGLPAPLGLNSLPYELQEAVLVLLEAKDLAALCCSSTPLRHRAATDALWQPLFDREFPANPTTLGSSTGSSSNSSRSTTNARGPYSYAMYHTLNRIRQDANRHGWKWAYGAAWIQRARVLEDERRRSRGVLLPHRAPYPSPMPWGPFRPQNPLMPPNVIGGDYDRFPNLGGFGGLGFSGNAGYGGLGYSGGVINPTFPAPGGLGLGLGENPSPEGVGLGSGGALFSGAQGRGGVLPGSSGNQGLGGQGGLGFPGLGGGRRREGGGGLGRLY